MPEEENIHSGHRRRMLKKYLQNGIDCFEEHEILEIMLYSAFSRRNTNDIAHRLTERFGSLKGVFEAKYEELLEINGIGDSAAALICFTGDLFKTLNAKKPAEISLDSSEKLIEYCKRLFQNVGKEITYILLLDSKYYLLSKLEISRGEANFTDVNIKQILTKVFETQCSGVVITHNHPSGTAIASAADITATRNLAMVLKKVGIKLDDHIIVGAGCGFSLRSSEMLKDIWS